METRPDDFSDLRKLLALKRHEQPPPRFFNEFSASVIERLRTPELLPQPTWWQRLGLDFDVRPAMVGALGIFISGLMLFAAMQTDSSTSAGVAMSAAPNEIGQASWMGLPALAAISHPSSLDEASVTPAVFGSSGSSLFTFGSQPSRLRL